MLPTMSPVIGTALPYQVYSVVGTGALVVPGSTVSFNAPPLAPAVSTPDVSRNRSSAITWTW